MTRAVILMGCAMAIAGCTQSIDDTMINTMENSIRGTLAAQGTVKQVEMTKQDENHMTGYALVQDASGNEGRFTCTAERQAGNGGMFDWRCQPPAAAAPAAAPAEEAAAPAEEAAPAAEEEK